MTADAKSAKEKREKRTITEIRESKRTGEKTVYMSVPDYTSAKWAEMAGVDVAVVGDSLAMIAHGLASTVPATMDMMVMHAQAIRRGAPNTFVLGCMPYQPCMGCFLSRGFRKGPIHFHRRFPCSIRKPVSSSRPLRWIVAGARRSGQGWAALAATGRLGLDGSEHAGTLGCVGMTIGGEPACRARGDRATSLYSVGPETRTMMQ